MRIMRPIRYLCLLLFLVVVSVTAAEAKKLRVGYLQSDIHHLPFWVAIEKGFFAAEGLDVEVGGIFKAGPEELSAFAAGALDAGYVGIAPTVTAVANKSARVKVVAQSNKEGSAIVAREGQKDLRGLKDRSVAIPGYSTVQDFLLKRQMEKEALSPDHIRIVVLKPPEMIPTLREGQIDAFIAWEPFPSKAVIQKAGTIMYISGKIWPDHPCCVLSVQSELIKKDPSVVQALVKAHMKAIRFINEQKEEAIKIAVKYTGMDEQTIRLAMGNVTYDYVLNKNALKEYVNYLTLFKYIKVQDLDHFLEDLVEFSFIKEPAK